MTEERTPDEMERQAIEDEGGENPPTDITSPDGEPTDEPAPEGYVDPSQEQREGEEEQQLPHQKLEAGLSPFGIMVRANALNGDSAVVNLTPDEAFTFAGHMIALGTVLMQMSIQQQMMEQARIQQLLDNPPGEERTKGGVYVKR